MLDKKIIYFLEVVEQGSFSGAARKLFLSQSALSQQVSVLEEELSLKLLDRSGYRPVLTEEGRRYYQFCRDVREQHEKLLSSLHPSEEMNRIRIAFSGAYENKELIAMTSAFKKRHPGTIIHYTEGSFSENAKCLEEGSVDAAFGLRTTFEGIKDVTLEDLYAYRMCVITSFDDELADQAFVTPEQLKERKFVVLSRRFGKAFHTQFLKAFDQDGCSREQIVKTADTFDELVVSVSIGEGIAVVSENVIDGTSVKKIPLTSSHHRASYVCAYKTSTSSALLLAFVTEVKAYFEK